jgi:hypothetical protein
MDPTSYSAPYSGHGRARACSWARLWGSVIQSEIQMTEARQWSSRGRARVRLRVEPEADASHVDHERPVFDSALRISSCSVAVSAVTGSLGGGFGHAVAKLVGIRSAGQSALGASLGGWAELVPGVIGSQLCGASSQTPTSK